jgi:hypothetical protein
MQFVAQQLQQDRGTINPGFLTSILPSAAVLIPPSVGGKAQRY